MKTISLANTPATITKYLLTGSAKGAVIICPGGAYTHLALVKEGEKVAEEMNKNGYHAFVLEYRVEGMAPLGTAPLYDLCTAIATVRAMAGELEIPDDKIAVLGFSAGGHLVASAGVFWNQPAFFGGTLPTEEYKPNAILPCYPAISTDYIHKGSFERLSGEDSLLCEKFSLEKQVGTHTPPTFLWHTAEDVSVPVENSLVFATALSKFKIPYELHIFPFGPHGIGLATKESTSIEEPHVAQWFTLAINWLDLTFAPTK